MESKVESAVESRIESGVGSAVEPSWDNPGTLLAPFGAILKVWNCWVDPLWYPGWTQVRLAAPGARFSVSSMDSGVDPSAFGCTRWAFQRLQQCSGEFWLHQVNVSAFPRHSGGVAAGLVLTPLWTISCPCFLSLRSRYRTSIPAH